MECFIGCALKPGGTAAAAGAGAVSYRLLLRLATMMYAAFVSQLNIPLGRLPSPLVLCLICAAVCVCLFTAFLSVHYRCFFPFNSRFFVPPPQVIFTIIHQHMLRVCVCVCVCSLWLACNVLCLHAAFFLLPTTVPNVVAFVLLLINHACRWCAA